MSYKSPNPLRLYNVTSSVSLLNLATKVACACLLAVCGTADAEDSVNFKTQIVPIFEQHCIRCHSASINKGDISLATFADLQANEYVIGGEPDSSYLLELLTPQGDKPQAMPMESEPLKQREILLLRKWIQQGAKWPEGLVIKEKSKGDESWWAFQPLNAGSTSSSTSLKSKPRVNASDSTAENSHHATIDDFIYAKLSENRLQPSPQADRRTLIRRLSFDLHGLPPTPEAVEAFVNDADPKAYELLVERMLESQRYGERYARHWLDIAHYADTHGFERDKRRDNAWRYRDYVIQTLNEDKPYNRFIQEQIAGDVLWPNDDQAVIATGFLAAGPWDFVGQVETKSPILRRSARSLDLDDMATQVMTATMGLTVNCARCHDHKLDPISHTEYYQLRAVFAGVKRADRLIKTTNTDQLIKQRLELVKAINELEPNLDLADIVGGGNGTGNGELNQGIDPRNGRTSTTPMGMFLSGYTPNVFAESDNPFIDGVVIPRGHDKTAHISITSTNITVTDLPGTDGKTWDAIRNGPVAHQHSAKLGGVDFSQQNNSLLGLHANVAITFDLNEFRKDLGDSELRFTSQVGYFGAPNDSSFADARVYVNGKKIVEFLKLKRKGNLKNIDLVLSPDVRFLTLMSTDGGNGISMDQIGFANPLIKANSSLLPLNDQKRLTDMRDNKRVIDKQLAAMKEVKVYAIVPEEQMPETRVLRRGNPEAPMGDPLEPGAFAALNMLDSKLGDKSSTEADRRVALSKWITDPRNPLSRRVIVNRLWQWHFGKGIVDTPSDFGYGGGRPSHPELLDWLAEELVRQKWSLKAMHRLIVTSETYKQTSKKRYQLADSSSKQEPNGSEFSPQAIDIDTDNRLLWRQNSRRIEAEAIRDSVLFVSGKLNAKRGGPGFEDFEFNDAYAPIYTYVVVDEPALWRHSIYRYIVRTTPHRFLTTLDCPDPANLTPLRMTTTTPLQSLTLYNNEFMIRQAGYLAERIEHDAGADTNTQVERAFGLAFGRHPSEQEVRLATDLVKNHGLFTLCRSLFNTNEFVYVD